MNLKRVWNIYLAIGAPLGVIKMLSVFSWLAFHPLARLFGLTDQDPSLIEFALTGVVGILSAAFILLVWPFAIVSMLTGSWSISEVLFYPWVLPEGAGWS